MQKTLYDLKEGAIGRLYAFADEMIAGRMLSMGVLPGSEVIVVRKAPFGGGIYLKVDGTSMVMRASEARRVILETSELTDVAVDSLEVAALPLTALKND